MTWATCITGCGAKPWGRTPMCKPCRAAELESDHKMCRRCLTVKPKAIFTRGEGRDGLHSYCPPCNSLVAKESVERFKARAKAVLAPPTASRCRSFINLGAWAGRVRCSRHAALGTGGFCLTHAPLDVRQRARVINAIQTGNQAFGSQPWRESQRKQQAAAIAADAELAALAEEQAREARRYQEGRPWEISLSSEIGHDAESFLVDFVSEDEASDYGIVAYEPRRKGQHARDASWVEGAIARADYDRLCDDIVQAYQARPRHVIIPPRAGPPADLRLLPSERVNYTARRVRAAA